MSAAPDPKKEIKSFADAKKYISYPALFSDVFVKGFIPELSERINTEKDKKEKERLLSELSIHLANYSVIIYYLYGRKPGLKEAIDSSPELSRNFKDIKAWLDANNGREYAAKYLDALIGVGWHDIS
ncbi:MAG: hypothetical protein QW035_00695 [Candidatus Anstonellales archaeon]